MVGASRGCRDRAAGRRSDRQGDDIQIEGRTDGLVAVQGHRGAGWSVPLQVASPAGEGVTGIGCSLYAHHRPRSGRGQPVSAVIVPPVRRSDRQGVFILGEVGRHAGVGIHSHGAGGSPRTATAAPAGEGPTWIDSSHGQFDFRPVGVGRLIRCFCHPAVIRDHRQGVGVLGEGRTDRLIAVEGDRVRLVVPLRSPVQPVKV